MDPSRALTETEGRTWSQLSDERLVALVQSGQTDAFEVLVRRYQRRLFNYIRRMTGSASDAEDLFQETFLRVYTHVNSFRAGGLFRPWVYRIATNLCKDHLRWWRRRSSAGFSRTGPVDGSDGADVLDTVESPDANPRDRASEAELAERVAAAVNALPVRHRAVFLMARYEGLSYEEIGNALGIPVGTVKSRMNKAVNVLMHAIEEASQ